MLERIKVFTHKDTLIKENSENRLLVYEHNKTQEAFVIEDPGLSLEHLEKVQKQVKQLLDAAEAETEENSDEDEVLSQAESGEIPVAAEQ